MGEGETCKSDGMLWGNMLCDLEVNENLWTKV